MKISIKQAAPFGALGLALLVPFFWYLYQQKPEYLTIAAGQENGDAYQFARTMEKYIPKYSNKKINIQPRITDGTQENLGLLKDKKANLATAQADILIMKDLPKFTKTDGSTWSPPDPKQLTSAQVVSSLFPDMYQLIVRNNSDIKSVSDLVKKKVAVPPQKGGQVESLAFLMQHYGLIAENQQQVEFVNVKSNKDALCNNQVDAVFYVRALNNPEVKDIIMQCGRLVPIDQAAALAVKNPYLQEAEIPIGAYQGGSNPIPKENLKTVSTPRLLLAHQDADKQTIRKITEILYNHRQDFIKDIPVVANINPPDNMKGGIGLPIHPGAQAYYDREKPSWWERYSGIIQIWLAIILPLGGWGFFQVEQREQKRKNKVDDYIREVNALMDAEDCIKAIIEYSDATQSNNTTQAEKNKSVIIDKAAKVLVEQRVAELARGKNVISQESKESFDRTLRKVIVAVKKLPVNASDDIFNNIPKKAIELLDKRQNETVDIWQRILGVTSADELRITEKKELNQEDLLSKTLFTLQTSTKTQVFLQQSDSPRYLKSSILEIRQDLNAIFKRAVNALVEERISQESFQSFRVIWQVAADDI